MINPYTTLGISESATDSEIKAAYRKLAKQYHPDVNGSEEKFKEINEAYSILSDPKKKEEYANQKAYNAYNASVHRTQNMDDLFNHEAFADIFSGLTGFHPSHRSPRNSNIRAKLSVSLESILKEQITVISIETKAGLTPMEIKIPAGIHDGAIITYRGLGKHTYTNQPPGDLMIEINVLPTQKYIRTGDDLLSEVTIDCFSAVLGTTFTFQTISNRQLKVNVPAGTQSGTRLRLLHEGLPILNNPKRAGHQYIIVNVVIPTNLTNEQLELTKKIVSLQQGVNNAT